MENMSLSSLLSPKSIIISLVVLLIVVGIGSFLYLTINEDFKASPHKPTCPTNSSPSHKKFQAPHITTTSSPSYGIFQASRTTGNELINIARQVWSIIDKNRAISNVQMSYGSVLPANITPSELQLWKSPPASYYFTANVYNRLKLCVLRFTYALQFTYGGSLNGTGAYLERITVVPSRISVAWAFTFNASVHIGFAHNVGTRDQPIAAAHVELHYQLVGLNKVNRIETFHVRGDGKCEHF